MGASGSPLCAPTYQACTSSLSKYVIADHDSDDILSITICHDPRRNRWIITSDDDWSGNDELNRLSLERDNALLKHILVPMLDQRSRDDLTPA
jgi:hypothetical protein